MARQVKTIDTHAHCVFAETLPLVNNDRAVLFNQVPGVEETLIEVQQRFAAMDAQRVDMEVLSVNPFWYGGSATMPRRSSR